jgi:hypothetical protein
MKPEEFWPLISLMDADKKYLSLWICVDQRDQRQKFFLFALMP